jgi:hypothetical protein
MERDDVMIWTQSDDVFVIVFVLVRNIPIDSVTRNNLRFVYLEIQTRICAAKVTAYFRSYVVKIC